VTRLNPVTLYHELHRRRVFRVAAIYAVAAWGVIAACDVIFPQLTDWVADPDRAMRAVFIAVIALFPVALIFGWLYDFTVHGVRRTAEFSGTVHDADTSLHLVDRGIIGALSVLVLAVLAVLTVNIVRMEPATITGGGTSVRSIVEVPEKSIAVLPFENRSSLEEDAFFVEGIHDDILTQLSKIGALTVIARTSVERFRGTRLPAREIAEQLGVRVILEGAVQRAGDRVRVNVQLIDAATENHLWAETYDRELSVQNIFAIQTEVAAAISGALQAKLSAGEESRFAAIPTRSLEAWEAYQLGRRRMARRTSVDLGDAEQFFQKAITLDPEFALAYVGLADTLGLQIDYGGIPASDALARARTAVARALELDPYLPEAATSSAWLAFQSGEFAEAETEFRRAVELNPNYATAYHWASRLFGVEGRFEEALRYAEKAVALDPLSVIINVNHGMSLERVARFRDALAAYRRAIEIEPIMPNAYLRIGALHEFAYGRLDLAMPWFKRAEEIDAGNPDYSMALASMYLDLGDYDLAGHWFEQTLQRGANYSAVYAVMALLHLYDGEQSKMLVAASRALEVDPRNPLALRILRDADLQRGELAAIRQRYASAFPELFASDPPQIDGTNFGAAVDLSLVLQKTGEHELAALLLERSGSFIKGIARMGWMGYRITDAQIHALRGDRDDALRALRTAEQAGWRFLWRYHRDHDPSLESIREDPEFKAIFADIERDMARQRAELAARPKDAPLDVSASR